MSHRVRAVPAVVISCLLLALAAAPASAAPRCDRFEDVLQTSPSQRTVVVRNSNYNNKDVYVACWRPTGRTRVLGEVRLDSRGNATSILGGFNFRGAWIGWGQDSHEADGTDSIRSLNLRSGASGPAVDVPSESVAGQFDGPIYSLEWPFSNLVAMTYSGRYAWVAKGKASPDGRWIDAVYAADGEGGSRRLGTAPLGAVRRIWIQNRTVFWRRGGTTRSAPLPPLELS